MNDNRDWQRAREVIADSRPYLERLSEILAEIDDLATSGTTLNMLVAVYLFSEFKGEERRAVFEQMQKVTWAFIEFLNERRREDDDAD